MRHESFDPGFFRTFVAIVTDGQIAGHCCHWKNCVRPVKTPIYVKTGVLCYVCWWAFLCGFPIPAAALNPGRTNMEMNTKNIITAVVVVIVVAVGGYYLFGSEGGEETVAPAAETG